MTGVSRRKGIGYAIARELADLGASVFTHRYAPHDVDQPWGAEALDAFWETDTRSTLLLTRRFAQQFHPGPVNTGYLDPESTDRPLGELEAWMAATPFGRWGEPTDPAQLIGWLAGPAGSWVVGQVLATDGGFGLQ